MSQGWSNWAGNQRTTLTGVAIPTTAQEVADAVSSATERGLRVKPIGAGHSFTGIGLTDGIQLDLSKLSKLISADRRTGLVTVDAGMPLHRLNWTMEQLGLSLSNLGDIDRQTVAGALSTGTHGTGRDLGGLATQIRALQIVLADGSIVDCSPQNRPDLYDMARVGLGALGVVTAVTLQAEPLFTLNAKERPMPLHRVISDIDELVATNEHFEFFWFPHTDKTLTKRNNRIPNDQAAPLSKARTILDDEVISNGLFELTCRLGARRPSVIPKINERAVRLMGDREYSDVAHRVFVSRRRVRFVEMEYALPREAVREAISEVGNVIRRDGLKVSFPVEVRFTAGDDIPMSTATGRDSAYVAIHMFRGQPFEPYFRGVEAIIRSLDGRPHWGKMHYRSAEDLRPTYPRFDEFVAIRRNVDPNGTFSNAYLDRVLGPL